MMIHLAPEIDDDGLEDSATCKTAYSGHVELQYSVDESYVDYSHVNLTVIPQNWSTMKAYTVAYYRQKDFGLITEHIPGYTYTRS